MQLNCSTIPAVRLVDLLAHYRRIPFPFPYCSSVAVFITVTSGQIHSCARQAHVIGFSASISQISKEKNREFHFQSP